MESRMRFVMYCFCTLFFLTCAASTLSAAHGAALRPDERRVITDNVNVRTGPGLRYAVGTQLDKSHVVRVLASSRAGGELWYRLDIGGGRIGWMAARYLSPAATADTAPASSTTGTTPRETPTATAGATPDAKTGAAAGSVSDSGGETAVAPGLASGPSSVRASDSASTSGPASVTGPVSTSGPAATTAPTTAAPPVALVGAPIIDVAPGEPLRLREAIGNVSDLDFTVFRKGVGGPGVLVFGGIQGDEPGGFSAASLLATHYDIVKGTLIVAPNLNFPSIVDRSRGTCGDMNRKFAEIPPQDPQYSQVLRVQQLIRQPEIGLILNLHDGSGFYHPENKGALRNPRRWGQSVIIDKAVGPDGIDLAAMAATTASAANSALLRADHHIGVRNTRTDEGNVEMAKTLTWFAVRNGKPAFGLEASKELGVAERTYYHLRMVEAFLAQAGIEFTRRFPLTTNGIAKALSENARYALLDPQTILPLQNIRPHLAGVLPLTRPAGHVSTSPLLAVTATANDRIQIHYGNRLLTQSAVSWHEADASLDQLAVTIDGEPRTVRFGEVVPVRTAFNVAPLPGYRINAIGATAHASDESGITLTPGHFQTAYSIDRSGQFYRVETYRDDRLVGMFVVAFGNAAIAEAETQNLPGIATRTGLKGR